MKYIYIIIIFLLASSITKTEELNDYVQDEIIVKLKSNNQSNFFNNKVDLSIFDEDIGLFNSFPVIS